MKVFVNHPCGAFRWNGSLFLDKLLAGGVGVGSSPAAPALTVSDLQVGGAAVNVVLAERRRSGLVIRVEDVGLLASFAGQSLLGEALVLYQLWVVAVFPSLGQRQRVLKHTMRGGVTRYWWLLLKRPTATWKRHCGPERKPGPGLLKDSGSGWNDFTGWCFKGLNFITNHK